MNVTQSVDFREQASEFLNFGALRWRAYEYFDIAALPNLEELLVEEASS
jgi:hypothetical protein